MTNLIKPTSDFFTHEISVSRWLDVSRRPGFFGQYMKDKKVLHVGCSDAPFPLNPETNLHVKLAQYTSSLDGFDLSIDQFESLKSLVGGRYFSNFDQLENLKWDVCLVPETIEHVDNIELFLKNLDLKVDADTFVITAPNCFAAKAPTYVGETYFEQVHPDHKVWFSPYTLAHCIRTFCPNWNLRKIWLIENDTMVVVVCERVKE